MDNCTTSKICEILGETKIFLIYDIIKSQPISFAKLKNFINKNKIKEELKTCISINEIAEEFNVSKMTVYRCLKYKK